MGLSSIAVQQREKEDEALKSFIVLSLIGSVGLHVAVLSTSNFWARETKIAEEPIEVIVIDTPKVEAAKPKPKPPAKIGGGSKPVASAKMTNPASAAKSAPKPTIAFSPPKVEKPLTKTTNIEQSLVTPQPKPIATPKEAEIPPTPKASEVLPPVPTPSPEVAPPSPTPVASLPSDLIAKLKSTPTPTPVATPTPKPIATPPPVSQPKPVQKAPQLPVAAISPQNNQTLTQVRSPDLGKLSNAFKRPTSASQDSVANSERTSSPSVNTASNNTSNSTSTVSKSGNNSNRRVRQGNNSSSEDNKVATATNSNPPGEDFLSPRAGSGGLDCRRCPEPAYPKRAERRGIQGTVQVVFDADRNGNISNIRVANTSGHDILDRAAIDAVKGWKLASSDTEQRGITQSFTFAKKGTDIESQARQRRERQEQESLAREKERQEKERLAREQQRQQREKELRDLSSEPAVPPTPVTPSPLPEEPVAPTSLPVEPSAPSMLTSPPESLEPTIPPE